MEKRPPFWFRPICLIAPLLMVQGLAWSQNLTPRSVQADNLIKRWSTGSRTPGQEIATLPPAPGIRVNEVYLDPGWKRSSIAVYGSEKLLDGYLVRYDLRANSIEFNIKNEIKILDVRRIRTMVWLDSLTKIPHNFINGKDYFVDNAPMTTLIEVLAQGNLNLYKQYTYWIKKPDFNPALDTGSPDERIYKKNFYYYGTDKVLTLVPPKKKMLLALFGDQSQAIKEYIKQNKLSPAKEDDLVKIFEYYNTLTLAGGSGSTNH